MHPIRATICEKEGTYMSELILRARDIEIEFTLRGKTLRAVRSANLDL